MRGAIPPLPNTPSWRGTQLKHRTTLPLPLYYLTILYKDLKFGTELSAFFVLFFHLFKEAVQTPGVTVMNPSHSATHGI
jgi:hypothetical protein